MSEIMLTKIRKLADETWGVTKFKFDGDVNHRIFVRKVKAENGEKERTVCEVVVDSFDTRGAEAIAKQLTQIPNLVGIALQVFFNIGDNDPNPTLRQIKLNVRQVMEEL